MHENPLLIKLNIKRMFLERLKSIRDSVKISIIEKPFRPKKINKKWIKLESIDRPFELSCGTLRT